MPELPEIEVRESEEELVSVAQTAVSRCNWVVGECAAKWTKKYARGRTDADFGAQVGLSGDQVYQRRRVWETFGDVAESYPSLKWSHFYVALTWDDAPECLQWAEENEATVAEMKAWRRAVRGEDLSDETPEDEWAGAETVAYVPSTPTPVRDPDAFREGGRAAGERAAGAREPAETVAGFARESDERGPASSSDGETATATVPASGGRPAPGLSAEQFFSKMAGTLERLHKALTPELVQEFGHLPQRLRTRFMKAADDLAERVDDLRFPS